MWMIRYYWNTIGWRKTLKARFIWKVHRKASVLLPEKLAERKRKRDPLTVIIEKINEKYGTNFTEMDKVLLQMKTTMPLRISGIATLKTMTVRPSCCFSKKTFPIWPLLVMSRMRISL